MIDGHYVYLLIRPWNGVPCYVGKGQKGCHEVHNAFGEKHPNRHLANILKKGAVTTQVLAEGLTEQEAFEYEKELIAFIGRQGKGGPLANLTDGGEGITGQGHSEEARKAIGRARLGKPLSEKHRAACVAAQNRPEVKAHTGRNSRSWHASLTPEQKEEVREKIRQAIFRHYEQMTPEQRALKNQRVSQGLLRKNRSLEKHTC